MASKSGPRDSAPPQLDDLDNFFLEGDLDDDPFASPKGSNKRKAPGDLNVDEEISVAKKARVPRIKLDRNRLLSQKGIPALRKRAKDLRLKGKGHEWRDASRLLSFYQNWLDDLFPKAKFVDALAMVEKAGHNKELHKIRAEWINEGRPKANVVDEGGDAEQIEESAPKEAERIAPLFGKVDSGRQKTPELDDLFGDEDDIYNATPIGGRKMDSAAAGTGDEPDEDELDALMAMEETNGPSDSTRTTGGPVTSLFGDDRPKATLQTQRQHDDFDELDAMIAAAQDDPAQHKPKTAAENTTKPPPGGEDAANGYMDDLDALMAETEAQAAPAKPAEPAEGVAFISRAAEPQFNDDEEAMAEMDGLW